MEKYPEKKTFIVEQIDEMDPKLAALAWENFLKRLASGIPEHEARSILKEELQDYQIRGKARSSNVPLLDSQVEISRSELIQYLERRLAPEQSRIWKSEFGEAGSLPRSSKNLSGTRGIRKSDKEKQ